jgi:hypothetical protein
MFAFGRLKSISAVDLGVVEVVRVKKAIDGIWR